MVLGQWAQGVRISFSWTDTAWFSDYGKGETVCIFSRWLHLVVTQSCDSWGGKESDTIERLNWTELDWAPNWTELNWATEQNWKLTFPFVLSLLLPNFHGSHTFPRTLNSTYIYEGFTVSHLENIAFGLQYADHLVFLFFFFFGVELLYNVMLLSAI